MQTPHDLIPAIGYIRVSWLQEEQISPDVQESSITTYATREGYRIVKWIVDLDKSGRNFKRRITEAITAVEDRSAQAIIVWQYSRFGRHRRDNHVFLSRVEEAGGQLLSSTEQLDARTASGKLARGVLLEFAAHYSDAIGERWAEAHTNRRNRGLPPLGRNRFGYQRRGRQPDPLRPRRTLRNPDDGNERYEPDPQTGPVLAEGYRRYIAGTGGRELAGWLNISGWYGTRGKPWSATTILRYLDSGFGAGLLHVHDPECVCVQPGSCDRRVYLRGAHDPVISAEEWQAYGRRRARIGRTAPRARVSPYPLSGRIWCGHCGAAMAVRADNGRPSHRYLCGSYLRKKECAARSVLRSAAESAVMAQLAAWADDVAGRQEAAPSKPVETRVDGAKPEQQIIQLDEALDRMTRQLALGLIPEDSYVRTRDELLAERAELAGQLAAAQATPAPGPREWIPVMRALAEEWHTLPADGRREMVADVIAAVRVFRDGRTAWLEIESTWGEVGTIDLTS